MEKRPLGLKVIASINFLIGAYWGWVIHSVWASPVRGFFGVGAILFTPVLFAFAYYFLQLGFITYKLNPESRKRNIGTAIVAIVIFIMLFVDNFTSHPNKTGECLPTYIVLFLGIAYCIWTFAYLTRPKVKKQFEL